MRHSFIPQGSIIIFKEGTKIIESNGEPYIIPSTYFIELDYDSKETDEYIFWLGKRCKKINTLVARRVH